MIDLKRTVIDAVRSSANKLSPGLDRLIEIYVGKNSKGLDIVYKDPDEFMKVVESIIGKEGAELFEKILIDEIKNSTGVLGDFKDLKSILRALGLYTG